MYGRDVSMAMELIIRFIVGGLVVCVFAVIGEMLKPKSFAGLFGAAPSVALATLGLAFVTHGGSYAGTEGRSMVAGAAGLLAYSLLSSWMIKTYRMESVAAASISGIGW